MSVSEIIRVLQNVRTVGAQIPCRFCFVIIEISVCACRDISSGISFKNESIPRTGKRANPATSWGCYLIMSVFPELVSPMSVPPYKVCGYAGAKDGFTLSTMGTEAALKSVVCCREATV